VKDGDPEKPQVLLFDQKTHSGFTTITSQYAPQELAALLSKVPPELSEKLKLALKGTKLEIPAISPEEQKKFDAKAFEEREREQLIYTTNKKGRNDSIGDFTPNIAKGVSQHEVAITNAENKQYIIGTFGADPCIIVAFYNPEFRTAGIAHIDGLTIIDSLNKYLDIVKCKSNVKLQAHIYGGNEGSKNHVLEILELLHRRGDVDIVSSGIIAASTHNENLAINSITGEVYTKFSPYQLDLGVDIERRMLSIQLSNEKSVLTPLFIEPLQSKPLAAAVAYQRPSAAAAENKEVAPVPDIKEEAVSQSCTLL
jgi:hypothetical protein